MVDYPGVFRSPKTEHTASAHTALERTQSQSRRLDSQEVDANVKLHNIY